MAQPAVRAAILHPVADLFVGQPTLLHRLWHVEMAAGAPIRLGKRFLHHGFFLPLGVGELCRGLVFPVLIGAFPTVVPSLLLFATDLAFLVQRLLWRRR